MMRKGSCDICRKHNTTYLHSRCYRLQWLLSYRLVPRDVCCWALDECWCQEKEGDNGHRSEQARKRRLMLVDEEWRRRRRSCGLIFVFGWRGLVFGRENVFIAIPAPQERVGARPFELPLTEPPSFFCFSSRQHALSPLAQGIRR